MSTGTPFRKLINNLSLHATNAFFWRVSFSRSFPGSPNYPLIIIMTIQTTFAMTINQAITRIESQIAAQLEPPLPALFTSRSGSLSSLPSPESQAPRPASVDGNSHIETQCDEDRGRKLETSFAPHTTIPLSHFDVRDLPLPVPPSPELVQRQPISIGSPCSDERADALSETRELVLQPSDRQLVRVWAFE